jgi:hypothetical protein
MRKLQKGDYAVVTVRDHAEGSDVLVTFCVVGRVHSLCDESITLDWFFYDDNSKERDSNVERITLVRSAIIKHEILHARKANP